MTTPTSRLSAERQHEIFSAVLDLIREVGYERLTFDAVASRARTSKATLYRQWQGKPGLVIAALQATASNPPVPTTTGDLAQDLTNLAGTAKQPSSVEESRLTAGLLHAATTDEAFAAAVNEALITPALAEITAVLHSAATRGEIADNPALFAELALLFAARHFFTAFIANVDSDPRPFLDLVVTPALHAPADQPPTADPNH